MLRKLCALAGRSSSGDVRTRQPRHFGRRVIFEALEARRLLTSAWQNSFLPLDVDDDGIVAPVDALIGINRLNTLPMGRLPLTEGVPPYVDTSGDGFHTPVDVLLVINALNLDFDPPDLTAALNADTAPWGDVNGDGITADGRLSGRVTDQVGVRHLLVEVDGGAPVAVAQQKSGNFTYDPLLSKDGSDDGVHNVRITAIDARGNKRVNDLQFVLDTQPPLLHLLHMADIAGDPIALPAATGSPFVAVQGVTEPGARVELTETAEIVTADATGAFTFSSMPLVLGENSVTVHAHDEAGNRSTTTSTIMLVPGPDPMPLPEAEPAVSGGHLPASSLPPLDVNDPRTIESSVEAETVQRSPAELDPSSADLIYARLADNGADTAPYAVPKESSIMSMIDLLLCYEWLDEESESEHSLTS